MSPGAVGGNLSLWEPAWGRRTLNPHAQQVDAHQLHADDEGRPGGSEVQDGQPGLGPVLRDEMAVGRGARPAPHSWARSHGCPGCGHAGRHPPGPTLQPPQRRRHWTPEPRAPAEGQGGHRPLWGPRLPRGLAAVLAQVAFCTQKAQEGAAELGRGLWVTLGVDRPAGAPHT